MRLVGEAVGEIVIGSACRDWQNWAAGGKQRREVGLLEQMVRCGWCDGPESVGCLDFRVRQTGDIRRGSQRGKVWRNHASEAAWEDHGRLSFIGWREVAERPEG
ncbi:hypothetical protein AUP45_16565 [Thalassospira xiamenensis]|nr:hypothetical protein AUP45_16565 [Thalassospira xiamenensis]